MVRLRSWKFVVFFPGLFIVGHLLLLAPAPIVLQAVGALVVAVLLPGLLLRELFWPDDGTDTWLEQLGLAVALGYAWATIFMLFYSYFPGGVSRSTVLLLLDALNFLLMGLAWWRKSDVGIKGVSQPPWLSAGIVVLLLVGGWLRLTNLGYSEFQGDEARAMLRAAAVIQGYEDVLFIHRKGPAEILLPALFYTLAGQIDEGTARLPFALANLTALMMLVLLGWRLLDAWSGWLAGMLLTVDGYFIAFARIVQYQSMIFLTTVVLVWLFTHAADRPSRTKSTLPVAALIFGVGLLAHYEAIMVVFPLVFPLWQILQSNDRSVLGSLGWSVVLFSFVFFSFYLPFVLNSTFADTYRYLSQSRVGLGGQFPHNNLGDFWERTTLYSPSLYLAALALFGLVALLLMAHRNVRQEAKRWKWILLPWWLVPFSLTMFGISDPRTHVYTAFFAWALLAGWTAATLVRLLGQRWPRTMPLAGLLGVLFFGYVGSYGYWYFVHVEDEILRNWGSQRPRGYPISYLEPVEQGIFGFPMRNGWSTVKALYDEGTLSGSYLTNVKPHVANWYLQNADLCSRNHRYYFFAEDNNQYRRAEYEALRQQLQQTYRHWGTVLVKDHPRLEIYDRGEVQPGDVMQSQIALPLYFSARHFDAEASGVTFPPHFDIAEPIVSAQVSPLLKESTSVRFGSSIQLLGYAVSSTEVEAGESVSVTLYWQTDEVLEQNYTVFNQLLDPELNHKVGQLDGQPGCEGRPTKAWKPDTVVVDRYRIPIFDDASVGKYSLIVGIYDAESGERLQVTDQFGQIRGDSLALAQIQIHQWQD